MRGAHRHTDGLGTFMPSLEAKRVEALYALEILDTPREERFDRITRTAVRLF